MAHQFSFEKLDVWQKARQLAIEVYITTKTFPADEKYGMSQQMRRAAISVCSNVAEGTSRMSAKDQARFTIMSFSSLMELLNDFIIACDLGYLNEGQLNNIRQKIRSLSIGLSNLKNDQIARS